MKTSLKTILINPFEIIAGTKALLIGLGLILLTGVLGYFSNICFDGIIDMHFADNKLTFLYHLTEGIINWVLASIILFLAGAIFSKTRYRLIDVFGTIALSRWPLSLLSFFSLFVAHQKVNNYILWKVTGKEPEVFVAIGELIAFGFLVFLIILVLIWMIKLMYNAYSISFNLKGQKAIFSFIGALFIAEIVSKFLISKFLMLLGLI